MVFGYTHLCSFIDMWSMQIFALFSSIQSIHRSLCRLYETKSFCWPFLLSPKNMFLIEYIFVTDSHVVVKHTLIQFILPILFRSLPTHHYQNFVTFILHSLHTFIRDQFGIRSHTIHTFISFLLREFVYISQRGTNIEKKERKKQIWGIVCLSITKTKRQSMTK